MDDDVHVYQYPVVHCAAVTAKVLQPTLLADAILSNYTQRSHYLDCYWGVYLILVRTSKDQNVNLQCPQLPTNATFGTNTVNAET